MDREKKAFMDVVVNQQLEAMGYTPLNRMNGNHSASAKKQYVELFVLPYSKDGEDRFSVQYEDGEIVLDLPFNKISVVGRMVECWNALRNG